MSPREVVFFKCSLMSPVFPDVSCVSGDIHRGMVMIEVIIILSFINIFENHDFTCVRVWRRKNWGGGGGGEKRYS